MIHISYDRRQYQEDMIENINIFDNVVEIGCHVGTSTRIISRLCQDGTVYAFDNSPESVKPMEQLKNEYQNVEFTLADVRRQEVLTEFSRKCDDINVLCIDLGGGYHPDTVFKVFFIWSSILRPRVSLIRNRGLADFINTSTTTEDISSPEGFLSSSSDNVKIESLDELKLWTRNL